MQVRRLRAGPGRELVRRLIAAIRDNDERNAGKPVLQLARTRRIFAPLVLTADAFVMQFNGLGRGFPWILAGSSTLIPRHGCI